MCQIGAELQSVAGERADRTLPKRDVLIDEDVGGVFSRKFRSRDGVPVSAPAVPTREEKNVAVAPRCDGKGAEVVDAHRDTRDEPQEEGDNGPTDRLSGVLSRLALEANGEATTACRCSYQSTNKSVRASRAFGRRRDGRRR